MTAVEDIWFCSPRDPMAVMLVGELSQALRHLTGDDGRSHATVNMGMSLLRFMGNIGIRICLSVSPNGCNQIPDKGNRSGVLGNRK
ncbi:hypothetical protein HCH_04876 [Hahella chejuensis KCTC 2396]|uniref:Uncharacterized protein n=1 Tax=Hahella chejuensis (strain KCTC 2396) TaxID=349521 RepID=Q2SCQ7_HAHCH|nr:hypothetical protein [Hahella chejuensis]ABC31567.1 hypothetical protein HCH_04876 [Hahella chejuensis KCTC 2396]